MAGAHKVFREINSNMFHIHNCEKNNFITEGTVKGRIKEERKKKMCFVT